MSDTGEYISREAAIESMYKDAEAHQDHTFWTTQYEALLNIPAADVRHVVYCRECIHWKKSELVICGNNVMVCDYHLGARYCRHADDFCSKGERREES